MDIFNTGLQSIFSWRIKPPVCANTHPHISHINCFNLLDLTLRKHLQTYFRGYCKWMRSDFFWKKYSCVNGVEHVCVSDTDVLFPAPIMAVKLLAIRSPLLFLRVAGGIVAFYSSFAWIFVQCGTNGKPKQGSFCGTIVWPSSLFCWQDQLRAAKGKISWRSSLSAQQRDGGVLRPGSPAAFTPQRQCSPGQGLHHEARNQLPAHAQAARHKYVQPRVSWWAQGEIHTPD